MDESFLEALLKWQSGGKRSINIKVDNTVYSETKMVVTCYDVETGLFFYPESTAEVAGVDMVKEKRKRIDADIKRMQQQLSELGGNNAA